MVIAFLKNIPKNSDLNSGAFHSSLPIIKFTVYYP